MYLYRELTVLVIIWGTCRLNVSINVSFRHITGKHNERKTKTEVIYAKLKYLNTVSLRDLHTHKVSSG